MNLIFKNFLIILGILIADISLTIGVNNLGFYSVYFSTINIVFVVLLLSSIFYFNALKPIRNLYKALHIIDFDADVIDFSKLDSLKMTGFNEIKFITFKFKYLLDIITERINKVNSEMYKSEHDELTGCFNRVYLQRIKSSYELANCFVVCFVDVNNLKRMNDEFGHEAGDSLLKSASRHLQRWTSIADVYRMGGDEFMFVIVDKPIDRVQAMIDKWYPTVGVLNRESDGFKCVLSYGIAYGMRGSDFDSVMKEADDNMYEMKIRLKKEFGEPLR